MRLVLLVRDGRIPAEALRMESQWTDAATPTWAAQADAAVKLFSADRLLPRRFARRSLGYSDTDIRDMEAEDAEAYSRVAGGDQAAEFGPKSIPEPREREAAGLALPSPRRPVGQLGGQVLPPPAVQFIEPPAAR